MLSWRGQAFHPKGDARLGFIVQAHVHGIKAEFLKLEPLDVDDEVAGDEMGVFGHFDGDRNIDRRHDVLAVGVDEIQFKPPAAFVAGDEGDAKGHRALRMDDGQLCGENGIERAEEVQLSMVVGRSITEDSHLDIHGEIKTGKGRVRTKILSAHLPLDIHLVSMYSVPMIRKELVAASAEPLILSLLSKGESYGYAIIQEIKQRSEGKLQWTDGMLYPVLHRMEHRGLIKSRWGESETGRKRKYYSLKKDGKAAMAKHQEQWSLVHSVLAGLKKEQYV